MVGRVLGVGKRLLIPFNPGFGLQHPLAILSHHQQVSPLQLQLRHSDAVSKVLPQH